MSLDRTAKIISFSEYTSFLELTNATCPRSCESPGSNGKEGTASNPVRFRASHKNEFFDVLDATGATSGRIAGMP